MHVKCEPIQRSQLISRKNADCAGPLKYHEISTFFQSSPTFFKLAEHIGIIIRNMHVKFEPIQRKMLTLPALQNIMNFIFFKVHQIKLAEFIIFFMKNAYNGTRNIMKFHHFFKIHLISSNLQNILESSSETCKWNSSPFREVKFFHRKMPTVPALEILWNFNIFQSSPNFIKLLELIGIIIRNMHVKFEPIERSQIFS